MDRIPDSGSGDMSSNLIGITFELRKNFSKHAKLRFVVNLKLCYQLLLYNRILTLD